jgi:hypothetical protein
MFLCQRRLRISCKPPFAFLLVFSVSGIRFAAGTVVKRLFRMRFLWRGVEQPGSSSGS